MTMKKLSVKHTSVIKALPHLFAVDHQYLPIDDYKKLITKHGVIINTFRILGKMIHISELSMYGFPIPEKVLSGDALHTWIQIDNYYDNKNMLLTYWQCVSLD
jgi:hypothetical protein